MNNFLHTSWSFPTHGHNPLQHGAKHTHLLVISHTWIQPSPPRSFLTHGYNPLPHCVQHICLLVISHTQIQTPPPPCQAHSPLGHFSPTDTNSSPTVPGTLTSCSWSFLTHSYKPLPHCATHTHLMVISPPQIQTPPPLCQAHSPLGHLPHTDALVLGVTEDELLSGVEQHTGYIVVMSATCVHLPGLGL